MDNNLSKNGEARRGKADARHRNADLEMQKDWLIGVDRFSSVDKK